MTTRQPFLKLYVNILRRPDHRYLSGKDTCAKFGLYVIILAYLSQSDGGVAGFHAFAEIAAAAHRRTPYVRQFVTGSGLFFVDSERQLFQSRYMCLEMGFRQVVGIAPEAGRSGTATAPQPHRNETGAGPKLPFSDANLIIRGREEEEAEEEKEEKEKKEAARPASLRVSPVEASHEPGGIRGLFADRALLLAVEQRVGYKITAPHNERHVRSWFAEYIGQRGYYLKHPLTPGAAARKLAELLRPGSKTREEMWQYVNKRHGENVLRK